MWLLHKASTHAYACRAHMLYKHTLRQQTLSDTVRCLEQPNACIPLRQCYVEAPSLHAHTMHACVHAIDTSTITSHIIRSSGEHSVHSWNGATLADDSRRLETT